MEFCIFEASSQADVIVQFHSCDMGRKRTPHVQRVLGSANRGWVRGGECRVTGRSRQGAHDLLGAGFSHRPLHSTVDSSTLVRRDMFLQIRIVRGSF